MQGKVRGGSQHLLGKGVDGGGLQGDSVIFSRILSQIVLNDFSDSFSNYFLLSSRILSQTGKGVDGGGLPGDSVIFSQGLSQIILNDFSDSLSNNFE